MPQIITNQPTVRSRYDLETFRERVRSDIAQPDNVFIANPELDRWGNEAQGILARDAQWFQIVDDTLVTSGGVRDYDLPLDCISISSMQYGIWPLGCVTLAELYSSEPLWRLLGPSLPRVYYLGGASRFTLFPTPAGASGMLIIYAALPPDAVGDQDQFYVPVGGDEALIYYACWKASVKDMGREGQKRAQMYLGMWERSLAKITAQARDLGEESRVVFGGGQLTRRGRNGLLTWNRMLRHPLPS